MRYISTRQVVYDITIYSILFWLRTTHISCNISHCYFHFIDFFSPSLFLCLILLTDCFMSFYFFAWFNISINEAWKLTTVKLVYRKIELLSSIEYVPCMYVHISHLRPFLSHFLSSYIPHLSACDDDCDNKQIIIFCAVLCCIWMLYVLTYVSHRSFL